MDRGALTAPAAPRIRPRSALLLLAGLGVLLLVPLPHGGRLQGALQDLVHVPLGVVVFLLVRRVLAARWPGSPGRLDAAALLLAAGALAAAEVVQPLVGRGGSLDDAAAGAAGAVAGLLGRRSPAAPARAARWALGAGAVVVLALASVPALRAALDARRQLRDLPLLASFEDDLEMGRWASRGARLDRVRSPVAHGAWALRVRFETGPWPSVTLAEPPRDWRRWQAVGFDVWVEGDDPLGLVVKIVDAAHDGSLADRFEERLTLAPGHHRVRIPLARVAAGPARRTLDLGAVAALQLYVDPFDGPRTIVLDSVWLDEEP